MLISVLIAMDSEAVLVVRRESSAGGRQGAPSANHGHFIHCFRPWGVLRVDALSWKSQDSCAVIPGVKAVRPAARVLSEEAPRVCTCL